MKEIPLTQGYVALVDDADFDAANAFKWHAHKQAKVVHAVRCRSVSEVKELKGPERFFLYQLLMPGVRYMDFLDNNCLNLSRLNLIPRKNQALPPWVKDHTGKKYGRWTVLEYVGTHPQFKGAIWRCRCECGNEKEVYTNAIVSGGSKSCGCFKKAFWAAQVGANHPSWKGGRRIDKAGYVLVNSVEFPGSDARNRRTVGEHIVVMARHLGRPLTPAERVHHKNGIRHDNRIENLELWKSSHPSGQRVSDLIAWAKQLLREYSPESLSGKTPEVTTNQKKNQNERIVCQN